jgi:hypothetical protein
VEHPKQLKPLLQVVGTGLMLAEASSPPSVDWSGRIVEYPKQLKPLLKVETVAAVAGSQPGPSQLHTLQSGFVASL